MLINPFLFGGGGGGGGTTWNPSDKGSDITLSGGNLIATGSGTSNVVRSLTSKTNAGKVYFEATCTVSGPAPKIGVGIVTIPYNSNIAASGSHSGVIQWGGPYYYSITPLYVNTGVTWSAGNVMGMAIDFVTQKVWLSRSGVYVLSGDPAAGTNEVNTLAGGGATAYYIIAACQSSTVVTLYTSSGSWAYAAPTGFGEWT